MAKIIMIVEDEKYYQEKYAKMFDSEMYNLIHAYDGYEAMQILEENKPDLIILDMIMNMVTGDAVFMHLKGSDELTDIPVIIISSIPQKKYKSLKIVDPNLSYLNKLEITKEQLLEEVDKRLVA
jgi:CheY-like chemotaxis protein